MLENEFTFNNALWFTIGSLMQQGNFLEEQHREYLAKFDAWSKICFCLNPSGILLLQLLSAGACLHRILEQICA